MNLAPASLAEAVAQAFGGGGALACADPHYAEREVQQQFAQAVAAAIEARGQEMKKAWVESRERTRQAAAYAWDAQPISTARMAMEVYAQIKDLDWSSVGADRQLSSWPTRLWPMDKHYHHIGGPGGFGGGYGGGYNYGR